MHLHPKMNQIYDQKEKNMSPIDKDFDMYTIHIQSEYKELGNPKSNEFNLYIILLIHLNINLYLINYIF